MDEGVWTEWNLNESQQRWWKLNVLSAFLQWPNSSLASVDVAKNVKTTHGEIATKDIVRASINALCEEGKLYRESVDGGGANGWRYRLAAKREACVQPPTLSEDEKVPCGFFGCVHPRSKKAVLCDCCEKERRADPEAFK